MASLSCIRVQGARTHNLKNISVDIPREKLIVITGPSGSGKSSLAFDTLYAEGQRRYVESLSTYARQFLDRFEKPEVESIEGLSPAIAIEQRTTSGSPRSTIATTTELYDFLRLLFTHLGIPHHPQTGRPLQRFTTQKIVDALLSLPEGTPLHIFAPLIQKEKGEFRDVFERMRREGYIRGRVDGEIVEVEGIKGLDRNQSHTIEALIDRLKVKLDLRGRITDSVETALKVGKGVILVLEGMPGEKHREWMASTQNFDPETGYRFGELTPGHFSFNNPKGACPRCHGLGVEEFDDPTASLESMPIAPWRKVTPALQSHYREQLQVVAKHCGESMEKAWQNCSERFQKMVLHGSGEEEMDFPISRKGETVLVRKPFEGVIAQLERQRDEAESESTKKKLNAYLGDRVCSLCHGARLKEEVLSVRISSQGFEPLNINSFTKLTIDEAMRWIDGLALTGSNLKIIKDVVREIRSRLVFLNELGLGYLTLDRQSNTLSGGESQRIRLATQIGSRLTGVLYILDEPSIGLHQRDHARLMKNLMELRDLGNTVIVVEHDEETMKAADYLLDLGPMAGARGGYLVAQGTWDEILKNPKSVTGRFLSGEDRISVPKVRRKLENGWIHLYGAREHNLKNLKVSFPLGVMTCVTGVSGSGKSTLINEVFCKGLCRQLYRSSEKPGLHDRIDGLEFIEKVVVVDQSPIGRTPRSNPVTYTGAFNAIRDLFAQLPTAKIRGYGPSRFSYNVKGGRCEHCEGDGLLKVEMNFLPPVYVPCEVCQAKRYNRETLEITYKGCNISEILEMTVDDALHFFRSVPQVVDKIEPLAQVGLGYLKLGQPATTLSGGESQRIKLAAELCKRATPRTIYIMDEPTTGLHFVDIQILLQVFNKLCQAGSTLIIIEHQLDVIKSADYIIDMGPEGGSGGGEIVVTGTPEEVAKHPKSHTARYLAKMLK
ncbi:MAG: excinuclease ABC subunit UvrA [Verrucomicrobiota bacterium]